MKSINRLLGKLQSRLLLSGAIKKFAPYLEFRMVYWLQGKKIAHFLTPCFFLNHY